ncbi:MAG TPA: TonB-dependent receptor [Bacteroidota bacterium]|nr:TonB-dependent receptor [Bacteroidota bacterium]
MLRQYHAILLLLLIIIAQETFSGTIKGNVRESKTKLAIAGASVFIEGTTYGTVSDTSGDYIIRNVPAGEYEIVVRILGFAAKEESITVDEGSSVLVQNFSLKEKLITLGESVVTARANNELETTARATEKTAANLVNVISAQTIEQSTDRTAADVLQRVSGMSLIRDQGEGRYVVMRGLAQQYNNTLVDGIKIPSPESKDRFVPMDIFPSGLFERIEVTKSLTPDIAGDAIGGSTDLMLREAPDRFVFNFNAASGSTSGVLGNSFSSFNRSAVPELDPERLHGTVSDSDPTTELKPRYNPSSADFSIANLKFTNAPAPADGLFSALVGDRFFDNRLGLMAAGSFQNTYNEVHTDIYSLGSDINTIDSQGHLIPYASTYNNQNYYVNKTRGGAVAKGDFIADEGQELSATYMYVRQEEAQTRHALQIEIDGSRGANDLTYTNRSALRIQDISSVSLSGSHFSTSPFSLNWTLNYTDALQDRPDEAEYSILQNYDANGKLEPFQGLGDITHSWRKNDDHQNLGKLDATWHLTSDGMHTIQAGFVAQKLNRVNYEDDYQLNPSIINGRTQTFTSIDSAKTTVFGYGSTSGTTVYGYQNYKASELLLASYLQYTLIFDRLQILTGVRWENAQDKYFTSASASFTEQQNDVKMVNVLPGIHFRYEFTPDQIGRLSVAQSLSRPSYFDLVPAVDRLDESQSQGNPNLRPARATNIDLRYEYYPDASDAFSAGLYYKRIIDPIEDQFQSVGVLLVTTKGNGDPAKVYGFEGVASKHFGGLGITANYSYVFSQITSTKQVSAEDIYGDLVQSYYQQKRPLQSQSPQIVNVTLSYVSPAWGTSGNLSYNYTGKSLLAVSRLDGYDTYQDGVSELDLSADQQLFSSMKISIKVINLTNSKAVTEVVSGQYVQHSPIVIERDLNKIRGSIGISYKL